jgi:hypothetical protein
VRLGQAGGRRLPQVHGQVKGNGRNRFCPQKAHAPRLDQSGQRGRRACNKGVAGARHIHLIVCHQNGPKADHLQRKR